MLIWITLALGCLMILSSILSFIGILLQNNRFLKAFFILSLIDVLLILILVIYFFSSEIDKS